MMSIGLSPHFRSRQVQNNRNATFLHHFRVFHALPKNCSRVQLEPVMVAAPDD